MPLPSRMPAKGAKDKIGKYSLSQSFTNGYHAKEDPTTLSVGTLVSPSQNVLVGTSGRIGSVSGYVLDGPGSSVIDSGILSSHDFTTSSGSMRNMRAGFLTSAGNDGKLQFRYVDPSTGAVTWQDLMTGLSSVIMSFCDYWDNANLVKDVLWVDGSTNIYVWNGATTTFASATSSTGYPLAVTIGNNKGTGYQIGDVLTISGGTTTVRVTSTDDITNNHEIASFVIVSRGPGYTVANNIASTGGSGTGANFDVVSVGNYSITKQGTDTLAQDGFYQNGGSVTVGGTTYTYSFADGSQFVGLNADPTLGGYAAGQLMFQSPQTRQVGYIPGLPATFAPTVIGCGRRNQVYLGSSSSNNLYISKVNNFLDYTFTAPTRIAGEGAVIPLDSAPTGFIPLETNAASGGVSAYDMYISEGLNTWAVIRSTLSSDLTTETLEHIRMKVAPLQGAFSEHMIGKMQNHIMFVGNDSNAYFFGFNSFEYVPSTTCFSTDIIDDMKSYDFTDGQIFNYRNYNYITVPKSGLIRVYNMTDQSKEENSSYKGIEDVTGQPWFWESPIGYPISCFYTVDGELYGHSYTTSESYKLFEGGTFAGQDIAANATFCYDDRGDRTESKASDEIWMEGYIKQNTVLNCTVAGDLDYFRTSQTVTLDGSDQHFVAYGSGGHSLGQESLGSKPLGGSLTSGTTLPAWFRVAKTYPNLPYYLEQVSFSTKGPDLQWELIAYGTNATFTNEGNNDTTD